MSQKQVRLAPVAVTLVTLTLTFAIGFNNCSQVKFEETQDAALNRLNSGAAVLINQDAPYTNSKSVILTLQHNSADEMYLTNDPTCQTGGSWEPYSPSKSWELGQSNAEAKVFAKFREISTIRQSAFESNCYSDQIIHDDIPPQLALVKPFPAVTKLSSVSLKLTAMDSLSGIDTLSCTDALGTELPSCSTDFALNSLPEGSGLVIIRAKDKAGNISLPLINSWVVDRTPPIATLNSYPPATSNSQNSLFQFSGTDNLSQLLTFQCRLGSDSYAPCTPPFARNLPEGEHKFYVQAVDEAGNTSVELLYTWKVDLTAPSVQITSHPPAFSSSPLANFQFTGTDEGQPLISYECQMNSNPYAPCSSPLAISSALANGAHSFRVRGMDSAGNVSEPAIYSWTVDTTKPTVAITSHPSQLNNSKEAHFSFTAQDQGSSIKQIKCTLNGAVATCNGSMSYASLTEGVHIFSVVAIDQAGNESAPTEYSWTTDLTPPTVEITSGPKSPTSHSEASFQFSAADNMPGTVSTECRLDGAPQFTPCTSGYTATDLADGVHQFAIRARDLAGNESAIKTYSWTSDRTPPAINYSKVPLSVIGNFDPVDLAFSVDDLTSNVSSVQCGFVGQLEDCPSSHQISMASLPPGSYSFVVIAVDELGNRAENQINWRVEDKSRLVNQSISVTGSNKADILVVIDNSGSMNPEQKNMAERFSTFLNIISDLDWQLSIITTDVTRDRYLRDGRFIAYNGLTDTYILNSKMDPALTRSAFSSTIQRPANEGSWDEQGIAATYRAIERSQEATLSVNAPNRSFFRANSALGVIVVSDADETNSSGTTERNIPENLVKLVNSTWPGKPFAFHSIVVKSGDSACLGQSGNEGYGVTYESLSRLTGGLIGSVCAPDYAGQLTDIGKGVIDLVSSVTLECSPLDTSNDGLPDVALTLEGGSAPPSYTLEGLKLSFSSPLPQGQHTLSYACR